MPLSAIGSILDILLNAGLVIDGVKALFSSAKRQELRERGRGALIGGLVFGILALGIGAILVAYVIVLFWGVTA